MKIRKRIDGRAEIKNSNLERQFPDCTVFRGITSAWLHLCLHNLFKQHLEKTVFLELFCASKTIYWRKLKGNTLRYARASPTCGHGVVISVAFKNKNSNPKHVCFASC